MNQFELKKQKILLVLLCITSDFVFAAEDSPNYPKKHVLSSEVFTPYIATYQVLRKNKDIGKAKRILEKVSANKYRLTTSSEASLLFYNFESGEESDFTIENDLIHIQKYTYWDKRTFKSKKTINQLFDWHGMIEFGTKNEKKWQRTFKADSYDNLNYILRLREDLANSQTGSFDYRINDEGKEEKYTLRYEGLVEVKTIGMGLLACHQITRYRSTNSRLTSFCFAPSLHYVPIMVSQSKDGDEQAKMIIDSIILPNT